MHAYITKKNIFLDNHHDVIPTLKTNHNSIISYMQYIHIHFPDSFKDRFLQLVCSIHDPDKVYTLLPNVLNFFNLPISVLFFAFLKF